MLAEAVKSELIENFLTVRAHTVHLLLALAVGHLMRLLLLRVGDSKAVVIYVLGRRNGMYVLLERSGIGGNNIVGFEGGGVLVVCIIRRILRGERRKLERSGRVRVVIVIVGIGILYKLTVLKSANTRGILLGKLAVVRNHNDEAGFGNLLKDIHNLHAELAVERACRFVGKNDFRVVYNGARDGYALHLSAGQLIGALVYLALYAHPAKRLYGFCSAHLFLFADKAERKLHVFKHGEVRYKIVALKNKSDGSVSIRVPVHIVKGSGRHSADDEVAAGIPVKTAYDIEQRSFAAAARTED